MPIRKMKYQKSLVLGEDFVSDTANQYLYVSQREYKGKYDGEQEILPKGTTLSLQIIKDSAVYPEGEESLLYETFDVTILDGNTRADLVKGDYVSLIGFREDASFYFNYTYLLRFDGYKKLVPRSENNNATTGKETTK